MFWSCEDGNDSLVECPVDEICGCTNNLATNYDNTATIDDGSCEYMVGNVEATSLSIEPSLSNFMIREILINTADKVNAMNGMDFVLEYGYGRINAYNALAKLLNRGDVNQDGSINVNDIISLVNIIFGTVISEGILFCAGDMNANALININDIVLVVENILSN